MFYLVAIDLLLIFCFSCKQIYPSLNEQKTLGDQDLKILTNYIFLGD
jgi:hypothetical protein